eukprot:TRINITY_DN2953_c0_g1_i1.p1 TRINITY_DN2953_c0_g1~~TRINITY_DN2953_c0_g1_i1.p1  ORF type:complete len:672 (-),score=102.78 TRINITY_DN2953_c0_g1_i1:490-2505(-)
MAGAEGEDDAWRTTGAAKVQQAPSPDGTPGGEDGVPFVHKVGVPPKEPFATSLKNGLNETFFPDDPFRPFKTQKHRNKFLLILEFLFPILEWGRKYDVKKYLQGDIIAGLTIASLAVPQDLGYAKLANLDPQYGLYTSFVPPLIYAVLGSSRHVAIGPVAVVSLLLGDLLKDKYDPKKQKASYERLAFTATFFAGVIQAALGIARLGFIIDFLSHPAVVGFMSGAAITIGLQQLKGFLNITSGFTTKTDIVHVLSSVFKHTDQWSWRTILLGLFFMAYLLITKYISKRHKKLFWVAATGPLVTVVLTTLFSFVVKLNKHHVATVGHIRKGVNPSSLHQIEFSGKIASEGLKIGIVTGLVGITEAIAIARTFASLKDYHVDGNKEFVAYGAMNIAGSLSSCYIATGSFSRSAVNYNAGVHTAFANIVMAIVVLFVLLVLTPLFKYTPNVALAVIIITAVLSLIDIQAAILIWKTDKGDFLILLGAFFGVIFVSVEIGLLIAVCISMAKVLWHVTRPHTAQLGNLPGTNVYRSLQQYPDASSTPGIIVVRVDAAIYFANSNYIRERILRWVTHAQDKVAESGGLKIQYVIIDLSPVMSIDTTGIHAFEDLEGTFKKRGIQLCISNPGSTVLEKFIAGHFLERLGQEWVFLTVGEAVNVTKALLKNDYFQEGKV